ncbi:MAG: hypothetical protein RBU23_07600 [Candidatus Auribacterota bacterium]|jgi:hypothetical protein|nr:hypothetical protein [Candidatus Auribacterota bacterium]
MKKSQIGWNTDTAGTAIAFIATACAFALSCRVLAGRFIQAGDSFWHYANEIHLLRSLLQGCGMFACFDKGMGLPMGTLYQPLLYVIVVLTRMLCPFASLFMWHNIYVCLLFSVYPLSVYFMVRSFRFDRLTAGLASLLSLLPVSGWGHTLDSYFWVGLHTQLIGAVGFPLALGAMHRLTWSKRQWRYLMTLAISLALVVAGHAVIGVLLMYTIGLYLIIFAIWRGFATWTYHLKKYAVAAGLALMLIGFWLIPFIQFNALYKFIPETQRSFSPLAVSLTVKQTVETFLYGELLDTNHPNSPLFGGGEEGFRWSMNQSFTRWRLFTIYTFIGFIILMFRARRFREVFWLFIFIWGFILFVGSDDLPWLRFLPYNSNFQPIRAVFLIELASAVLSAIALRKTTLFIMRISPAKIRTAARIVSVVLLMTVTIPLYERFCIAGILVKSGYTPDQEELMRHYESIDSNSPFARTYFGRYSGISKLSLRSLSDCFFIPNIAGHDNDMAGSVSWLINDRQDAILYSEDFADLLSLRYVAGVSGWLTAHQKIAQQLLIELEAVQTGSLYDLYKRKGTENKPLSKCWKKPILVYCSDKQWYHLNQLWLSEFIKYGYEIAPMIKAPALLVHWLEPSLFSAVILIDFRATRHAKKFWYNNMKSFAMDGGKILSTKPLWDIPAIRLTHANQDILSKILREAPALNDSGNVTATSISWNRITAKCSFDKPHILWSPMAFYRAWQAKSNDIPLQTFSMTPGVTAVAVSSRTKDFSIEYIPLRAHWVLMIIGWLTVLFVIWYIKKHPSRILLLQRNSLVHHTESLKNCFKVVRLLTMLVLIWIGLVYSRQAMERQTVLIYPYPSQRQINPFAAIFRWNTIDNTEDYHFQIADNKKSFDNPVFEVKQLSDTTVGYRGLKPFTMYYWRVKSTEGRWSSVRSFKTGGYYPVSAE